LLDGSAGGELGGLGAAGGVLSEGDEIAEVRGEHPPARVDQGDDAGSGEAWKTTNAGR
jgi:hypothetical protein